MAFIAERFRASEPKFDSCYKSRAATTEAFGRSKNFINRVHIMILFSKSFYKGYSS